MPAQFRFERQAPQEVLDGCVLRKLQVAAGVGCGPEAEDGATRVLKQPELVITLDLQLGSGRASVLTCDFSLDYVRINADYLS